MEFIVYLNEIMQEGVFTLFALYNQYLANMAHEQ